MSSSRNQGLSSSRNQRSSSPRNPKSEKREADASLTSFKVSDLKLYETRMNTSRLVAFIFLAVAVIAALMTAVYFFVKVHGAIDPSANSAPLRFATSLAFGWNFVLKRSFLKWLHA